MSYLVLLVLLQVAFSQDCPSDCSLCVFRILCKACKPSFNLYLNNTCLQTGTLLGCELYTLDNSCARCSLPYTLFNGICYPPVDNCQSYSAGGTCEACLPGYSLFHNRCLVQGGVSCPVGQTIFNGSCVAVKVPDCLEVGNGQCLKCQKDLTLINGLCIILKPKEPTPNQTVPTNPTCLEGEYLINGQCNTGHLSNCSQRVGLVCLMCAQSQLSYVLVEGACLPAPSQSDPNCINIDANTLQCVKCMGGYLLNRSRYCSKVGKFCSVQDNNGNCLSCPTPLTLLNDTCVFTDSYCLQFSFQILACKTCIAGYEVKPDGKGCQAIEPCLISSNNTCCSKCIEGFVIANQTCYLLPPNCQVSPAPGICTTCITTSSFLNGSCVFLDPNCELYSSQTGKCQRCSAGYSAFDNVCRVLPANCTGINYNSECVQCNFGFQLRSGICVADVPNCVFYGGFKCKECQLYFYTSPLGDCIPYPPLCNLVDSQGHCISCENRLTLYLGSCVYYQTFCAKYSTQGSNVANCIKVPLPFYVNENYVVTSNVSSTWDSKGNILTCKDAYQLIGGSCVKPVQGCLTYDPLSNCQQCLQGFALINNICALNVDPVTLKPQLGCGQGLVPYNGTCFSLLNQALTFNNLGIPLTVQPGYSVTSFGFAFPLPLNCDSIDATILACTKCSNGYSLFDVTCIIKDPQCLVYNERGICQICSITFQFIQGICRSVLLCDETDQNGCITCVQGAKIMSGTCIPNFDQLSCLQFDAQFSCLECRNGYYLGKDECLVLPQRCVDAQPNGTCLECDAYSRFINNSCISRQPNCQSYDQNGLCNVCNSGYVLLTNLSCSRLPPLCSSVDITTSRCVSCLLGYGLTVDESRCALILPSCSKFFQDGTCGLCSSNYSLVGGKCVTGLICPNSAFRVYGGICILRIPNCQAYIGFNCTLCKSGFYLNINLCTPNPPNCETYIASLGCSICSPGFESFNNICLQTTSSGSTTSVSSQNCLLVVAGYCTSCKVDYLLDQGKCHLNVSNCLAFSTTGTCLVCTTGFYINRILQCQPSPDNCTQANSFGICLNCIQEYNLIQSMCILNVPGCESYQTQTKTCTKCVQNLTLINGNICVTIPANCDILSLDGKCNRCSYGYILWNETCLTGTNFCNSYSANGTCAQCVSGFYLTNLFQCGLLVPYCTTYNLTTKNCTKCYPGFTLTLNTCVNITLNCEAFDSLGKCFCCRPGFILQGGLCNPYTINIITLVQNSGCVDLPATNPTCPPQSYSVGGQCYKNIWYTHLFSAYPDCVYGYSSISTLTGAPIMPRIGAITWWQAENCSTDQWVGYSSASLVTVQSIQLQGNGVNAWVTSFIVRYRQVEAPFDLVCVNNCSPMPGPNGASDISTVSLLMPIVTKQVRLYPQQWINSIACRFQVLVD